MKAAAGDSVLHWTCPHEILAKRPGCAMTPNAGNCGGGDSHDHLPHRPGEAGLHAERELLKRTPIPDEHRLKSIPGGVILQEFPEKVDKLRIHPII